MQDMLCAIFAFIFVVAVALGMAPWGSITAYVTGGYRDLFMLNDLQTLRHLFDEFRQRRKNHAN